MIKIPPKPSESPLFPYEVTLPSPQKPPKPKTKEAVQAKLTLPKKAIDILSRLSENVIVAAEIKAYLQNIVTFLRLHRAVDSGITPRATKHFDMLVKYNPTPPSLSSFRSSLFNLR